jgi:hypothetical protein
MNSLSLLRSAILASLLCVASAAASEGAPILLDQSYQPDGVNDSNVSLSCFPFAAASVQCGQSFTVGLNGTLTAGELFLLFAGGTPLVGLYDISGPLTLLETSSTAVAVSSPGFYSFAFSTPVTVGNTLALLVDVSDPGDSISFRGESPEGYAAGVPITAIDGTVSSNPFFDLYFRTHVDINPDAVPEPASLLLLGAGLAALGARRYRQKRSDATADRFTGFYPRITPITRI